MGQHYQVIGDQWATHNNPRITHEPALKTGGRPMGDPWATNESPLQTLDRPTRDPWAIHGRSMDKYFGLIGGPWTIHNKAIHGCPIGNSKATATNSKVTRERPTCDPRASIKKLIGDAWGTHGPMGDPWATYV